MTYHQESEGVTGSDNEPFSVDDVKNKEEEVADAAADEGAREADNNDDTKCADNDGVVGGVARWCGAEGVTHAAGGSVTSSTEGRVEWALSPHRSVSIVI